MTDFASVMKELEACGTAQNRKVYARQGMKEPMFGVSYANLGKLTKRIKQDQALAEQLWDSGVHDARVLATMIADPSACSDALLARWVKQLNGYPLTDALSRVAAESPGARKNCRAWIKSKSEWISQLGWNVVTHWAFYDPSVPDDDFRQDLALIKSSLHKAKNRTRHSMNNAIISIGMRSPALKKEAIRVAKSVGKVEVDHGETACKTPDAVEYLKRVETHRKAKAKSAAAKGVRKSAKQHAAKHA